MFDCIGVWAITGYKWIPTFIVMVLGIVNPVLIMVRTSLLSLTRDMIYLVASVEQSLHLRENI